MHNAPHEFVTVDMRGIKEALVARARADRTSVSSVVRAATTAWLGCHGSPVLTQSTAPEAGTVKLSIRFTRAEADRLAAAALAASLSRAAYLAGLVNGTPALTADVGMRELKAALTASNSELASLVRSLHHLTTLLRQGSGRAAQEYRAMLARLADDVRRHLKIAGAIASGLQPRGPVPESGVEDESGSRR